MARQKTGTIARLVWARRDLPRPLGLEIRQSRDLTVYLPDVSAWEAWLKALLDVEHITSARGFRYCAGWLTPQTGDEPRVSTTIVVREDQEGSKP